MATTQDGPRGSGKRIPLALGLAGAVVVVLVVTLALAWPSESTGTNLIQSEGATQSSVALPASNVPSADETGAEPSSGDPASATQTSDGGQVTVKVTMQASEAGTVFDVALDTHSVNLDAVDLQQLAIIRIDGSREVRPLAWDAPKGGHHRSGKLVFPDVAADGGPVVGLNARSLELIIRDVAGVPERIFTWDV